MNQLEQNIVNSFRIAKGDIIKLQGKVLGISQAQERILEMFDMLKERENKLYQKIKDIEEIKIKELHLYEKLRKLTATSIVKKVKVVKTVTAKRKPKIYVSSKTGKKFHLANCPFAQNIKPKHKVVFKSKTKALNEGLKPCNCIK